MKIVFMGTPDFAVPALKRLATSGKHDVVGVVCQPDKPVGRKQILTPPAVKILALELGLDVFQPQSLKTEDSLKLIQSLDPEIIVVAAYGKILPESILLLPKHGCICLHGSLLPKYRGAAPIQRAVIDGEKITGITVMQMDKGIDTGDIISTSEVEIGEAETAGELFDRLADLSAEIILPALDAIENGTATRTPQNDELSSYAAMLSKSEGMIDWSKGSDVVFNHIRGMNPWPVAYTVLGEKTLKVFSAEKAGSCDGAPGEIVDTVGGITVACGDGSGLILKEVQLEGSRRMTAEELLRGHRTEKGTVLKGI
ncbi:MAG: methionyl-tRNA formyltransferase [Clostridia bacterium]|nr:methionyl-tRNA formyltransferase [Clostridia bacterium]